MTAVTPAADRRNGWSSGARRDDPLQGSTHAGAANAPAPVPLAHHGVSSGVLGVTVADRARSGAVAALPASSDAHDAVVGAPGRTVSEHGYVITGTVAATGGAVGTGRTSR
jgi:hypothetical protein